jgi:hypothetical protein
MKTNLIFLLFIAAGLHACQSPEAEKKPARKPPVNLALRIWGEEGSEFFHCLAQVQSMEAIAATGKLSSGETLAVDGISLLPDSARYSGVFYQADLPVDQFAGEHNVSLTSSDGRTHSGKFDFTPFSIKLDTGIALTAGEMEFQLLNFPGGENQVHLLITDTAYATDDINTFLPINDGRLVVSPVLLSGIKRGPVVMQIIFETEKFLSLGKDRVKLLVSYSLAREIILK